jgi:hypothetical protein
MHNGKTGVVQYLSDRRAAGILALAPANLVAYRNHRCRISHLLSILPLFDSFFSYYSLFPAGKSIMRLSQSANIPCAQESTEKARRRNPGAGEQVSLPRSGRS